MHVTIHDEYTRNTRRLGSQHVCCNGQVIENGVASSSRHVRVVRPTRHIGSQAVAKRQLRRQDRAGNFQQCALNQLGS